MRMLVTNLRDEQQSVTIPLADGRVIRELIQPGETRTITDIDPFDINTHKISRRLVFQQRHLDICFAAEPDDLLTLTGLLPLKGAARVATTGNITLSGLQVIDSVQLAAGDRVLVHAQTNPVDNGIWVAQIGAWARARDANGCAPLLPNSFLWVSEGTTHDDTLWRLTTDAPITVGTTPQTWDEFVGGGAGADVKVSANDTTPGFLEDKVVTEPVLEINTLNDGADEDLQIRLTPPTTACQIIAAVGSPASWKIRTPLVSCDGWLTNDQFELLYVEEDSAP